MAISKRLRLVSDVCWYRWDGDGPDPGPCQCCRDGGHDGPHRCCCGQADER